MHVEGKVENEDTLELACMAKRLTEFEEAYKTKLSSSGYDNGLMVEPDNKSLETNVGVDDEKTGSVYSVVESSHNEVGEADEEEKEEEDGEKKSLYQDVSSEEKEEVTYPVVAVKEEVVVREVNVKRKFGLV
ncbi:unnamed protein product [Cochlearia groenlandica]